MDIDQIKADFAARFNTRPRIFRAPGRVNLIGEHTDYNDGFVMPFAIDRAAVVAAAKRGDRQIHAFAKDLGETAVIRLDAKPERLRDSWVDYVEGTARCAEERFGRLSGADIILTSDVPIGSGLSSSAAIETAIGFALLSVSGIEIDRERLAFAAQKAEHEYAGTRSGIMDQFASSFCRAGNAMLLDCRSLERTHIPFETDETITAICDTGVKHSLASSEYNKRRQECEEGVRVLKKDLPHIRALRDVSLDQLEENRRSLSEVVYRRCRHVITENERTLRAAEHFQRHEPVAAGKLMSESHYSLRDDYEVSCPELDVLVDIASEIEGVYGARMTGGGFGGCTVNLLRRDGFDGFTESVQTGYKTRFGREPEIYKFKAGNGASEVAV